MKLGRKSSGGRKCFDTLGQVVEVGDLIAFKHPYTHSVMEVAKVEYIGQNVSRPTVKLADGTRQKVRTIFVKTYDQTEN